MPNTVFIHADARRRTRNLIEEMYDSERMGRAQREAVLKGIESGLRDYERAYPHRPRPER